MFYRVVNIHLDLMLGLPKVVENRYGKLNIQVKLYVKLIYISSDRAFSLPNLQIRGQSDPGYSSC